MSITFQEYLDFQYAAIFKELLELRGAYLTNKKETKTSKVFLLRNNTEVLNFSRKEDPQIVLTSSHNSINLEASAPNLDSPKYSTNIIIPPKSLIVAGYLEKASASKLPSIIMYDVATQFKGENVKVIKNDILINKKKVCGIETFALNKGIWFECFINVEPFNVKNLLTEDESKNAKPIGFLTEELPKFDFDKMIKIIKKDFKDFIPII